MQGSAATTTNRLTIKSRKEDEKNIGKLIRESLKKKWCLLTLDLKPFRS